MKLLSGRGAGEVGTTLIGKTDDIFNGENRGVDIGKGKRNGKQMVEGRGRKGDARVVVMCSAVEEALFGEQRALEKDQKEFVKGKSFEVDATIEGAVDGETEMEGGDAVGADEGTAKVEEYGRTGMQSGFYSEEINDELADSARLPGYGAGDCPTQALDAKPESIVTGGSHAETEASEGLKLTARRLRGQRRAHEREIVRRAGRRGVVFGFTTSADDEPVCKEISVAGKPPRGRNQKRAVEETEGDGGGTQTESRRRCEAVIDGIVVEPSFAKGEWGVRWRE